MTAVFCLGFGFGFLAGFLTASLFWTRLTRTDPRGRAETLGREAPTGPEAAPPGAKSRRTMWDAPLPKQAPPQRSMHG